MSKAKFIRVLPFFFKGLRIGLCIGLKYPASVLLPLN